MFHQPIRGALRNSHELQAAIIRLIIWMFALSYIGLGWLLDYYDVDGAYFLSLFGIYLAVFTFLLIDVSRRPNQPGRTYIALLIDVTASSLAIFLTQEAISPFYLLYIWIFQSYGTRFGTRHLYVSSLLSVLAYSLVLTALNEWQRHPFEAVFFLFLLLALPWYQLILLRKLHQARQDAQAADRAKSEFLANMTHEIRTPLNGIVGMATLLETTRLDKEQQGFVNSLQASAKLLQNLIGDVLDLSKIDSGQLLIEHRPYDLHGAVREVTTALAANAHAKQLDLVVDIENSVPVRAIGDETRVRQVLYNLLGNAIKFTSVGEVLVRLRVHDDGQRSWIQLSVHDTGIGIAEDKLGHVFDRFWQADPSNTRKHGGTGLGTTIAHNLMRLMDGRMEAQSAVGEGSTFTAFLPLNPATTQPQQPVFDFQGKEVSLLEANAAARNVLGRYCTNLGLLCHAVTSEDQLWSTLNLAPSSHPLPDYILISDHPVGRDLCDIQARLREMGGLDTRLIVLGYNGRIPQCDGPTPAFLAKPVSEQSLGLMLTELEQSAKEDNITRLPTPKRPGPDSKPILVAEDDEIGARVIYNLLLKEGYRVTLVRDGRAALETLHNGGHCMAIIDMRMPEMDGLEFTRRHRKREKDAHLPIIALTADASAQSRDACLAAGMDDFLTKPVDKDKLMELIPRYLG
ncbi:MAG: response regulator [Chromatiales bacterium]|nr:response regulator [Chromatiales bacterium]